MSLIKNVVVVGGWTLAYRISSFIRDIAQSCILGAGMFADVFSLSFKFANILRKIFAEGSFNASFLPIFSNALNDKGNEEAQKIASQVLTWLVFLVSFIMVICLIYFRHIMRGYAPGIDESSEQFEHLVIVGRVCSPYIAASFFAALFGGILNTLNRYAMPAAAQLILNISIILALFMGALFFPSVAYTMAWATLIGGVLQVAVLWVNVKFCGFKIGFDLSPMKNEVKLFFKKLLSGAIGAGVWQLNVLIDFIALSFLPTGAVSYFYYTEHVNQVPIGILGIAFSSALLPPLTRAIHANNNNAAKQQMNYGLLFALIFTLPTAAILISLSEQIVGTIYGRGNFTPEHVVAASPALAAFAFGLPAYTITKVLSTTFFAHKDTRTPLIGGIVSIVTNLLFIFLLTPMLKHTGIALATSLSAYCNGLYLMYMLRSLGTVKIDAKTIIESLKQCVASAAMFVTVLSVNPIISAYCANHGINKSLAMLATMASALCVFFVLGKVFRLFCFLDEMKKSQET